MIAFPLPAAAAELPAGVQQILQQSELTPDKLVHITLQELLQTLAGWLKNAWEQPLQLARRAVLFLLLSSCVGLLADGGAWRDCVDLVAVLGFGTIALNQMTSLVQQVAQAANTSQLYVSGFVPVFAGVALLAGQTAGAAVYSTMFMPWRPFWRKCCKTYCCRCCKSISAFPFLRPFGGIVALPMPQTCLPAVLPLRSNCAVCCLPLCWGCKMCWPPGLTAQP